MKNVSLTLFWLCVGISTLAQKEDNIWMLSGDAPPDTLFSNSQVSFFGDSFQVQRLDYFNAFSFTNASISSHDGQLLVYTNGTHIFNRNHAIMQNGNALQDPVFFAWGYRAIQGALLLSLPDSMDLYFMISADHKQTPEGVSFSPLHYSIVDLSYNNGLGKVTLRKISLSLDTFNLGRLTQAVKKSSAIMHV